MTIDNRFYGHVVTHIPTGTVARQETRRRYSIPSLAELAKCKAMLASKLSYPASAEPVREYDMAADTVTDLRTGETVGGVQRVLDAAHHSATIGWPRKEARSTGALELTAEHLANPYPMTQGPTQ
jgi:hypothetical protein